MHYHLCVRIVHVMCTNVPPVLLYTRYHLDFNIVLFIFIYLFICAACILCFFKFLSQSYSYSIFKLQITVQVSIFTI